MLDKLLSFAWLEKFFPALALALFYILCVLALHPFEDLPLLDDWTYAWSVEHLLKAGELRLSDRSVHYLFTQILWGALFCVPFGFSFSALRVSTVVLSWLGALAFYGTLRELGHPRMQSLIATILLPVNPVFFILTFSYMTDVPFVSLANIAFFFLVRGVIREKKGHVWLGSLFVVLAFFVRQLAVAIPTALLSYFFLTAYRRRLVYLLPAVLCVLFLLLISLSIIDRVSGFMPSYAQRLQGLQYWFRVSPIGYAAFMLRILLHVGLALSPLTLPLFAREMRKPMIWVVTLFLFVLEAAFSVLTGNILLPLEKGAVWALEELGATLPLLGGASPLLERIVLHPIIPPWLNYPIGVLSLFSAAMIILRVIELIRERRPLNLVFLLYAVLQTALIFVLWLFYDRYYLVLLPPLIVVLLVKGLPGIKGTMVGIAIFFVISLTGTWDNLQLNRATNEAFTWLLDKGIPIADIDAGFPFNGWNFYVHPANLPPEARADQDVQRVTADVEKPYVIAASPLHGYHVLREVPLSPSFWIATDRIYVLKK